MAKSLVIVESPAKAKTIRKYLGADFDVRASVGHILDLPANQMGVDLESGDFTPEYVPITGKSKVIKEIKDASKKVDTVYLAPDPDREGEAIAFHLAMIIDDKKGKKAGPAIYRVRFHEITKNAVREAFKTPTALDEKLFDAQQARRVLDRVVGYQISPVLWKKVRRGLSAGRVQSVAVRIVVDREREILAFITREYWTVEALGDSGKKPKFKLKLSKTDGKKADIEKGEEAHKVKAELEKASAKVSKIQKTRRTRKSGPPFITSKLQQDAARAFKYSPKRTMAIAQGLYEGVELGEEGSVGLITYMRTDSTRVSDEALTNVREYIGSAFGNAYLPAKPNVFKTKKGAQEAHEAIRPTGMKYSPDFVKAFLKPEQYKLYKLIWERFVASQMVSAEFDQTAVDVSAGRHVLRATGSIQVFDGFLRVYSEQIDEDDASQKEESEEEKTRLPEMNEGDTIKLETVEALQHFTQPPPRFNEASLIKELEDKGVGRPSTYAAILSTIQDKEYAEKREGRLHPTELGILVTDLLVESFPLVMDVAFTAGMEEKLDKIEEGSADYKSTLREFYEPFKATIAQAQTSMRNVKRMEEPTDIKCEKCGKFMVIKWGRTGSFLGCSGYPECKNTQNFHKDDTGKIIPEAKETTDQVCKTCGSAMVIKRGRYGKFLGCSRYPECEFTMPIPTGVKCPKPDCGGDLVAKRGKKGKDFYGCSNYPNCDFVSWDKPINQPCPVCNYAFVVEKISKTGKRTKCMNCNHEETEGEMNEEAEKE
jgi:DNA topoisomerase-1